MRRISVVTAVLLFAALAGAYALRDRLRQYFEDDAPPAPTPVEWVEPEESETPEPGTVSPETPKEVSPGLPFAIDLSRPLRITWPLDVGPDVGQGAPDGRLCLRSRQGTNEFLTSDDAAALYAFRLAESAKVRLWFRARYTRDGVGKVDCNNSCIASLDGRPGRLVGNDSTRPG
jgi:hypothetical protein